MRYINTYFRIDTGYLWGSGLSEEKTRRFYDEITLLFVNAGWDIQHASSFGNCIYVIKDKTKLYVHPMELTGPCREELIPEVTALLEKGRTWSLTSVERFEECFDLNSTQLLEYYRKDTAKADGLILDAFRKNRYLERLMKSRGLKGAVAAILFDIGGKIRVNTLESHIGRSSSDVDQTFLRERYRALVEEGRIDGRGFTAETEPDKDAVREKAVGELF